MRGNDGASSEMTDGAFLYILRCADGSYYVGITRTSLEMRVAQHNAGTFGGHTLTRCPVVLVYSQWFDRSQTRSRMNASSRDGAERKRRHLFAAI
jgi:predicted GIY-YIG superfamily endonuclease